MKPKKLPSLKIFVLLLLVLESALVAVFGLGMAYHQGINPGEPWEEIEQIGPDGKLASGAALTFHHLLQSGNHLTLRVTPMRPPGSELPQLTVSVCGEELSHFTLSEYEMKKIPLYGTCEPFRISIATTNPYFLPNDTAPHVGVRMLYAEVNSKLGVPLVALRKMIPCFLGVFVLSLLFFLLSVEFLAGIISLAVPVASFFLIRSSDGLDLRTQYPLWVFWFLIALGALICKILKQPLHAVMVKSQPLTFEFWGVVVVLILGAALRLYGISFGLPFNFHPDEIPKVNAIMRMAQTHSLNPAYFLHPSLLLYLSYFSNIVLHFFGMGGGFRDSQFLAGRLVSACAGIASIYLVYAIGRRFFSGSVGLFAAALLAASPLHITCSRYMKEDALLTFFVLAATLAMVKAVQENKKLFLCVSAALVGCAAGSKYPGVLASVIVISAPWLRSKKFVPDREFILSTIGALVLVPVFFIICTPYSVITPQAFLHGLAYEHAHMERGHSEVIDAWSQLWMYHFWRSFLPGLTPITACISIAGVGFLLWRRRIDDLFIVGMILTYYLPAEWVKAKPAPQPERYVLPCLPFLAIAASAMLSEIWRSRAKLIVPVLGMLALVCTATRATELASEVPHDTRLTLAAWMKEHLDKNSKIDVDVQYYGPAITNSDFTVRYLPRMTIFESLQVKALRRGGADYFVLSSLFYNRYFTQPNGAAVFRALLRDLETQLPIVRTEAPEYGTYGFHNPKLTIFSLRPEDIAHLQAEEELKHQGKIAETSNDKYGQFW